MFFEQISKMSYFPYMLDVIYTYMYDPVGVIRKGYYFCGFYWRESAGESLTNLKGNANLI